MDQLLTSLSPGKLQCCSNYLKLTLMWFSVAEMYISVPAVDLSVFLTSKCDVIILYLKEHCEKPKKAHKKTDTCSLKLNVD